MLLKKYFFIIILCLVSFSVLAESGIYVGGYFRRDSAVTVPTLKSSGFTYVILFNITVEANGDLTSDNILVCSDGEYVFDKRHPNYVQDVTSLKRGFTSIRRIETCIGGWGSNSYTNIKTLIQNQGVGSETVLFRNFKALKEAIPAIDAINNDDEHTYDVATATAFHIMLYDIGFNTTIAPYTRKSFWQSLVTDVQNQRPGAITQMYLQCYDGGASNNPIDWYMGDIPLHAGMLHFDSAEKINTQMSKWKSESNVSGGFLWVYNANDFNLQEHADAINTVFGGGEVVNMDEMRPCITVFSEKNFAGKSVSFQPGEYSNYAIECQNFNPTEIQSVKVNDGFKMELYKNPDNTGESILINSDIGDLSDIAVNYNTYSWTVTPNGDKSIANKIYHLQNKESELFVSLSQKNNLNNTLIQQKNYESDESQQWQFAHLGNGLYRIINRFSKKTLQIQGESTVDGAYIEQGTYQEKDNQKFIVIYDSENAAYKIKSLQSLKYLSIEKNNESEQGANIVQDNTQSISYLWNLNTTESTQLNNLRLSDAISVYPTFATDILYIDSRSYSITDITISDLHGRIIRKEKSNQNRITIADLDANIYFIFISLEGIEKPVVSKFIKQRSH